MDEETREILHCFVDEGRDAIMVIESLLEWIEEESPEDRDDSFGEIFRRIHSMKGNAGYLNLNSIQRVSHRIEGILTKMMDGSLPISSGTLDTLSLGVDFIAERLEVVIIKGTDSGAAELENRLLAELGRTITDARKESGSGVSGPLSNEAPGPPPGQGAHISAPSAPSPTQLVEYVKEASSELDTVERTLQSVSTDLGDDAQLTRLYRAIQTFRHRSEAMMLEPIVHLAHVLEESVAGFLEAPISPEQDLLDTLGEATQMLRVAVDRLDHGEEVHVEGLKEMLLRMRLAGGAMDDTTSSSRLGQMLVDAGYITPLVLSLARSRAVGEAGVEKILMDMNILDVSHIEVARGVERDLRLGRAAKMPVATSQDRLHETVRVDVALLDELSRLVALLSRRGDGVESSSDGGPDSTSTKDLIRTLRDTVYRVRMSNLDGTFRRMRRVVADVAAKRGKLVRLQTSGEEIPVERRVVEVISDALVHLLRNAVDHGIEEADVRSQHGKPIEGVIRISVHKSDGGLSVQVSDDGRGLNTDRIYERAVSVGLTTKRRDELSDSEILALVFQSGVSTATTVSEISGRGIGLDVVRLKVESVGGEVRLHSRPGTGTDIEVWFPPQDSWGES